jgi:hypothetical protein
MYLSKILSIFYIVSIYNSVFKNESNCCKKSVNDEQGLPFRQYARFRPQDWSWQLDVNGLPPKRFDLRLLGKDSLRDMRRAVCVFEGEEPYLQLQAYRRCGQTAVR